MGAVESMANDAINTYAIGPEIQDRLHRCYRMTPLSQLPSTKTSSLRYGNIEIIRLGQEEYVLKKVLIYPDALLFMQEVNRLAEWLSVLPGGFVRLMDFDSEGLVGGRVQCITYYYQYPHSVLLDEIRDRKGKGEIYRADEIVKLLQDIVPGLAHLQRNMKSYIDMRPANICSSLSPSRQKEYKLMPLLPNGDIAEHSTMYDYTPQSMPITNPCMDYTPPEYRLNMQTDTPWKGAVYALGMIAIEMGTLGDMGSAGKDRTGMVMHIQTFNQLHRGYHSLTDIVGMMIADDHTLRIDCIDLEYALQHMDRAVVNAKVVENLIIDKGMTPVGVDVHGARLPVDIQPIPMAFTPGKAVQGKPTPVSPMAASKDQLPNLHRILDAEGRDAGNTGQRMPSSHPLSQYMQSLAQMNTLLSNPSTCANLANNQQLLQTLLVNQQLINGAIVSSAGTGPPPLPPTASPDPRPSSLFEGIDGRLPSPSTLSSPLSPYTALGRLQSPQARIDSIRAEESRHAWEERRGQRRRDNALVTPPIPVPSPSGHIPHPPSAEGMIRYLPGEYM